MLQNYSSTVKKKKKSVIFCITEGCPTKEWLNLTHLRKKKAQVSFLSRGSRASNGVMAMYYWDFLHLSMLQRLAGSYNSLLAPKPEGGWIEYPAHFSCMPKKSSQLFMIILSIYQMYSALFHATSKLKALLKDGNPEETIDMGYQKQRQQQKITLNIYRPQSKLLLGWMTVGVISYWNCSDYINNILFSSNAKITIREGGSCWHLILWLIQSNLADLS